MIRPELEAEILRLHHVEKWRPGTIANHLGIHHSVVARVVTEEGVPRSPIKRPRMIDPYVPFILDTLGKYPRLSATRLYQMVKERGYPGQSSQFRALVADLRPERSSAAYLRLNTLPGEQAQVDWGHFGRHQVGRASRPLSAFVMVFSYSRALYLRFFLSQSLSNFLHGHRLAFGWAGGVVRTCLYDNLKSVVLERVGRAIRFNPQFLQFAGHYRYEARPVAPARGNEKGRVERAVRFVRDSFFAARRFKDLDDLNRQALKWAESVAMERRWPQDRQRSVGEVFARERQKLLPLPDSPFPCDERLEVRIPKTPYARFDLNEYSVPHTYTRRILVVMASLDTVRILAGNEVIATHRRSYDRGCQIEDPRHIEALAQEKAQAGQHRRTNLLSHAVPSAAELLEKLAERGLPLGRATNELLELQRTYGAEAVEAAIREVLEADVPHTQGVRHILERNRREAGRPPARPLPLPDDPRVRHLHVRPHDLETYDQIQEDHDDDQEENSRSARETRG
jgi:transposase